MNLTKRKERAKAKAKALRTARGSRLGWRKQHALYMKKLRARARAAIASGSIIYPEDQREEMDDAIQTE